MKTVTELRQQYLKETGERWSEDDHHATSPYLQWLENKVIEASNYNRMTGDIDISHCIENSEGLIGICGSHRRDRLVAAIADLQEKDRGIVIISGTGREESDFESLFNREEFTKALEFEPINWEEKHSFQEDKISSPIYKPKRKKFKRK